MAQTPLSTANVPTGSPQNLCLPPNPRWQMTYPPGTPQANQVTMPWLQFFQQLVDCINRALGIQPGAAAAAPGVATAPNADNDMADNNLADNYACTIVGVKTASIVNAGSGYALGDTVIVRDVYGFGGNLNYLISISSGPPNNVLVVHPIGQEESVVLKVTSVNGTGGITGLQVINPGIYVGQLSTGIYLPGGNGFGPSVPLDNASGGVGTGATVQLTWNDSGVPVRVYGIQETSVALTTPAVQFIADNTEFSKFPSLDPALGMKGNPIAGGVYFVGASDIGVPPPFRPSGVTMRMGSTDIVTFSGGPGGGVGSSSSGTVANIVFPNPLAPSLGQENATAKIGVSYNGIQNTGVVVFSVAGAGGGGAPVVLFAPNIPASLPFGTAAMTVGSLNGGSILANGSIHGTNIDFAEYEFKSVFCADVPKGAIVGFDAEGLITDRFEEAESFGVKSTAPAFCGGADYAADLDTNDPDYKQKFEKRRKIVDRIAYAGRIPVNVEHAKPGDWIVPVETPDGGIAGMAVDNTSISFNQYRIAVGRVRKILDDGRPQIAVKMP